MTERSQHAGAPQHSSSDTGPAAVAHATVFTAFLVPLIVWLAGRERNSFTDSEGKEALNFSLLVTLGYITGAIVGAIPGLGFVGWIAQLAVFAIALILGIQGAVAASRGTSYRCPCRCASSTDTDGHPSLQWRGTRDTARPLRRT